MLEASSSSLSLPSSLMDGYLVLSAALARKLDVLLLPRQVLLAGLAGMDVGALSFVHGVPEASTAAGVTHAQDKRLRRKLLNLAGLPTPPGITFSSRGLADLQKFTSRYGYPVVLKEAIGENPSIKIDNIANEEQLLSAITRMRLRSEDHLAPARSLITSGYAENLLSVQEDVKGQKTASARLRLLVEKRVSGRYIRCLVCGDRVLQVIERNKDTPEESWRVLNQVHDDFKELTRQVSKTIPGLSIASIDFVVQDPIKSPSAQTYFVVELCERPRLDSYMAASRELGALLADNILGHQAEQSSVELQNPENPIALRLRLESLPDVTSLLPVFRDVSYSLHLAGYVRVVSQFEGVVEGHIQGVPSTIASVLQALSSGIHFGQRAITIDARQTCMERCVDFEVRECDGTRTAN